MEAIGPTLCGGSPSLRANGPARTERAGGRKSHRHPVRNPGCKARGGVVSVDQAKESDLLSQKDLMEKLKAGIRTVQRFKVEFELQPVDFYGVNPLYEPKDVEAALEKRRLK